MCVDANTKVAELLREDIEALREPAVVEFGTSWCGYCLRARSLIDAVLADYPDIKHIKIEDGPGRPLGRSFRVKHWPTIIFLRDGREVTRLVRPVSSQEMLDAISSMRR